MGNWTMEKMLSTLKHEASKLGLSVDLGTEDGFTWVTLYGDQAAPNNFDRIGAMVADSTGRDFYANSVSVGSMCGALDIDSSNDSGAEPFHYLKRHIEGYGTKFTPSPAHCKYRRGEPTFEEAELAREFLGPCDAGAQERVDAMLAKNPSLAAARLESVVWEVQNPRGGPMQRSAPLWWAALSGSDPEGWSSWMSVTDSEISAEALMEKAGALAEPEKRLRALAEFGIKPRRPRLT
jgi:hypothetical protein